MLTYIEDDSGEVRQAASYGIGVMAKSAGTAFAEAIKGLLICICTANIKTLCYFF